MTAEELLRRYTSGERNFSGIRVTAEEYDSIFEGKDLSGINLCGSTLSGNWSGVNLNKALLREATGNGWDLRQGNLSQANLSGSDFIQCDLTGCNFTEAILFGTAFRQVVADGANFTRAWLRGSDLSEADLEGANFSGASLKGVEGLDIDTCRHFSCTISNTQMPDGSLCSE
jgi:BTB/POZ domain-containing protein KCTD9